MNRAVPDYESLKEIARKIKCPVKELIVLSPQNDPYYVGSPTELRSAEWIAEIVKEYLEERGCERVHDRAIHYYILSKGLERPKGKNDWKRYEGDINDFKFTMKAIQNARILGLIPWSVIEDKRNPDPIIMAYYWQHEDISSIRVTPEQLAWNFVEGFQPFNPQLQQAYHVEIWTEKTTINNILIPIARKYGVNLQAFSGHATATRVYELMRRVFRISKPVRILYISDFDKYGHNMPVATGRKIQWFVDNLGVDLDIKLDKILLTEEQVEFYDLPSAPGEENKVELDALEVYYPGEIKKIVEEAVSIYIDLEVMEEVNRANAIIRQELYSIIVDELEPIRDQLESIQLPPNLVGELPKAEIIEEESNALYDSSRDYVDQTLFFKQFLRSRS